MRDNSKYKIGLTELISVIQVTIITIWYFYLAEKSPIDALNLMPFQVFGWLTTIAILVYTLIQLKYLSKIGHRILKLIFAIIVLIVFYSLDKVADRFPDEYKFEVTNNSGVDLDKIIFLNHDSLIFKSFKNKQIIKAKLNYREGENIYIVCHYNNKIDTTYLPIGGTNSIGYKYYCNLTLEKERIQIGINEKMGSR